MVVITAVFCLDYTTVDKVQKPSSTKNYVCNEIVNAIMDSKGCWILLVLLVLHVSAVLHK